MNAKEATQIVMNRWNITTLDAYMIRHDIERAIVAAEEAERKACAEISKAIREKELRRLDIETCCSNTAAEIEECIRARSEGEKKGE